MTQASHAPFSSPVSVIGSQFMAPYQFDMIVDTNTYGNHVVTDINHRIMLKVKPCDTSLHYQRVVLDIHDKPIVTIREKIMSGHHRWNVFRGDSKNKSDKLFSAQTPHMIQLKTILHVFLTNKTSSKDVCDFIIKGSWSKRNCTIYTGDGSTTIAQMSNTQSSENVKFVKDKFMVTIYANVDYAFVVSLITVVEAMKMKSSTRKDKVARVGKTVGKHVIGAFLV